MQEPAPGDGAVAPATLALTTAVDAANPLAHIRGLAWRDGDEIRINPDRPFIPNLDDLPMPLHERLPLHKQHMPMIKGPFTFIVTSRGCPAGCKYCIKHVSYQNSVRLRSPQNIFAEIQHLAGSVFTTYTCTPTCLPSAASRSLVSCRLIIDSGLQVRWTCNSRVDYVDEEMLRLMGQAGCWYISWGIESANEEILKRARKGYRKEQAFKALKWSQGGRHQ